MKWILSWGGGGAGIYTNSLLGYFPFSFMAVPRYFFPQNKMKDMN
jgi:hypothetical protein